MTTIGAYLGGGSDGATRVLGWAMKQGVMPGVMRDALPWNQTTDGTQAAYWAKAKGTIDWICASWRDGRAAVMAAGYPPYTLALHTPLCMKGDTLSLDLINANADFFTTLARKLIVAGLGNSIIVLGWECSGNWMPWYVGRTSPAVYIACYRQAVALMRAVPGASFRFVWGAAFGGDVPTPAYPGDDVVDAIGSDIYAQTYGLATVTDDTIWNAMLYGAGGLNWLAGFASAHGKPVALPEWATGTKPDGKGGGDRPAILTKMSAWLSGRAVLYAAYWTYGASDYDASFATNPLCGAAFSKLFGPMPQPDPLLHAMPPDQSATVADLTAQLGAANMELATLRAAAPVLQQKVDDLTSKLTAESLYAGGLMAEADSLRSKLTAAQSQVTDIAQALATERGKRAAFNAALDGMRA